MSDRLTDKTAIGIALRLAYDSEEAMCDAYSHFANPEAEPAVIQARRRMAAFKRLLDRFYGGHTVLEPTGKPISIFKLMSAPDQGYVPLENPSNNE